MIATMAICREPGCGRAGIKRGWCNTHYEQRRRAGEFPLFERDPVKRFWSKVDKNGPGGCWLWTGPQDGHGYGVFYVGGRGARRLRAHRVSYEWAIGPIHEGAVLDHVAARGCRHRHCVNPAHLEPVTQRVNILRGTGPSAGHARKTHCVNGHLFDDVNTYMHDGVRKCRKCGSVAAVRAWRRRQQAAKAAGLVGPSNIEKTHCPKGHPYSGENLYETKDGRRHCKECNRTRAREHARRKRAAAST
jgi:hypothetical protein